jgi:1-deoxy-D-xylulose-5-phosphate synthase
LSFDLSYLRCIPNIVVAAPSDENECRQLLFSAYDYPGPAAVRYPRGEGIGIKIEANNLAHNVGEGRQVRKGKEIAILNFGVLLPAAVEAASRLDASVYDMRWVKPLDEALINQASQQHKLLITLEENTIVGGAGSAVAEYLSSKAIVMPLLQLGLPDKYIDHGNRKKILAAIGLDASGMYERICNYSDQVFKSKTENRLIV